jgi:hypothetical protein
MRPHQSFHLYANTRIRHLRNNSESFTKRLNILLFLNLVFFIGFFFCIIYFTINTFLCLFYSRNFLSSYTIIHCSPFQLLFLPFLIYSLTHSQFPSYPLPTCHHTNSPSFTLITCLLSYCKNCTQPQPPAIPDTGTLHDNRNTPKHTPLPTRPFSYPPF